MQEDNFSIEVVIGFFKEAYPKNKSKEIQEFNSREIKYPQVFFKINLIDWK